MRRNKFIDILTSLRLTVACLAIGLVLVFLGTLAQVDEGLYQAQNRWFRSFFIWWNAPRIPIFPGGYLVGTVLLANLVAAHIKRFQFTRKKLGIHVTHAGIILLLLGQLATDLLSRESQMRFVEGETRDYSESGLNYELAFISDADSNSEDVVAIPESFLDRGGDLNHEKLPFTVRVKKYWRNSELSFRAPMAQKGPPVTTNGVAQFFDFSPQAETRSSEEKNIPTAMIELATASRSLGDWVVPGWAGDQGIVHALRNRYERQMGDQLAESMIGKLTVPQRVEVGGRQFTFSLRPSRVYNPFSITLLRTTHETYRGTTIPKNFQSRVRIENPAKREAREVDIYMNNPLRYEGLTFYQYQMIDPSEASDAGRAISVLQMVRNPSWLTPYVGCGLVGGGLVIQFMMHLVGFIRKRRIA